jgi:predicted nucleic acid-binding protein
LLPQIAAHAITAGATLVSHDKAFAKVGKVMAPRQKLEVW